MCSASSYRHIVATAIVLLWLVGAAPHAAENQALEAALQTITATDLGHHVDVLADDTFEGREAGARGGQAAGGYLVQALEENGIRPAGVDGGFYQTFGPGMRNVLGVMQGSDPKLKHEFILLGAHYDHVGFGSSRDSYGPIGHIHNGADDNASGTAGLLEVMQAFSVLAQPPRRSILFAFWDGEEKGMLGSKQWASYPTVPLKNVVFSFNVDMIGRLRDQHVEVYGVRTAGGLRQLVSRQNTNFGLDLDFVWDVKPNSDHYSFFEHEVPFLMLHTGLHDNYHRPSDDAELINREGMQAVTQLMFRLAYELADADQVPAFRPQSRFESNHTRAQFERSGAPTPPRLGISWSREDNQLGLLVTRVSPRSAGEQAGLTTGDRIIRFDGRAVESGDQFRLLVLAAGSVAQAIVQRSDAAEPIEVQLHLPGKPVRIGISWDQDQADPATMIITRVVPGSAAELAGLAPKDRVYAVEGRTITDAVEFGDVLTHHNGPLQLLVERQGLVRSVTLHPLEDLAAASSESASDVPVNHSTAAH